MYIKFYLEIEQEFGIKFYKNCHNFDTGSSKRGNVNKIRYFLYSNVLKL